MTDVLRHGTNYEDLYSFGLMPAFFGTTDTNVSEDLHFAMDWQICKSTGLIALKDKLPLDTLYKDQTTTAAIGPTWIEHHQKFASFIAEQTEIQNPKVFEIGGAHGILEREFTAQADNEWTIVEPNPTPVTGCKANFIKAFFTEHTRIENRFDIIVHSHTLEHVYNVEDFLNNIHKFMANNQSMIFSIPDLAKWLRNRYLNALNFEHTYYLSETLCDDLLQRVGFKVLAKKPYKDGHSIFYHVCKINPNPGYIFKNEYKINRKLFMDFVHEMKSEVASMNAQLHKHNGPKYVFGAHIFTQYLIKFGLNLKGINTVLDNDTNKQNSRLYGTELMVNAPDIIRDTDRPMIVLRAGHYNSEIKKQILTKINKGAIFI